MIVPKEQNGTGDDFVINKVDVPVKNPQPSESEIAKLKEYITFIVGENVTLSLDEVVKKLADQWRGSAWKIAIALRQELHDNNRLREQNWQTIELTNSQLIEIGKTYGIPFCIYHIGTTNSSGHYVLLTSIPEKRSSTDTQYSATAYDPIRGAVKISLSESQLQRKLITCIVKPKPINFPINSTEYQLALIKQIVAETNGYDLTVPQYQQVSELSLAKMQPLQNKDGFNCGLWCLIYAMTAMAYKRGENIFKRMGLAQITNLCQVALVTPETG